MSLWSLVLGNVSRSPFRTGLLAVTVAIAFLIYGVLTSFLWFFNGGAEAAGAERLITTNRVHVTQPLPLNYFERIAALPETGRVAHSTWFGGYYQEPRNALAVFAIDAEPYLDLFPTVVVSAPAREAFLADRNAVLVGAATARRFGWKPGDSIPLKSSIFLNRDTGPVWTVRIAGLFEPGEERGDSLSIYMHYDLVNEGSAITSDRIGLVISGLAPGADPDRTARRIDALFENSPSETRTQSENAFNKAFLAQIGDIALIVQVVVGAAMLTVLLVVMNTMLIAVRERHWEYGVLKALGFRDRFIFALVLAESSIQVFLGGLSGLALAAIALLAIDGFIGDFVPGLKLPLVVVGGGFAIMLAISLVVGAAPAIAAFRKDVVTALARR